MRVLQIIGTMDAAYGGPVVSARSLSRSLKGGGHQSTIIDLSANRAGSSVPLPDGAGFRVGRAWWKYKFVANAFDILSGEKGAFDVIVSHGIWQYQSLLARRLSAVLGVPYFVFIHGALDPWFRKAYPLKHIKKQAYWALVESKNLEGASGVIFTCEEERILAHNSFVPYRLNARVVEYGIDDPVINHDACREVFLREYPEISGKRVLLFLGRLHKKKGLDLLVDAFAEAAKRDGSLVLVVAGPDEDGLQAELVERLVRAGVSERVFWVGLLGGDLKWGAFAVAELFCLISHSENFGIAVAEALACGLPVLITDKVNIHREITRFAAGLVVENSPSGARHGLSAWLGMGHVERESMRGAARLCFESCFDQKETSKTFIRLLESSMPSYSSGRA